MALSNLIIYGTWKNVKKSYRNTTFKIPALNEKLELPGGSYSVSNIQDCFNYIIKKHETVANNPPTRIYVNIFLTPEIMNLFESIKSKITKDGNGENLPHLEIIELVLVHYNIVNNNYQQN